MVIADVEPTMQPADGDRLAKAARNESHLETRHLLGDLKNRAVSSSMVSVVSQAVRFLLTIVSVVVLSRLLIPEDFGLVAMITGVMALFSVFRDAGLSTATVQHEEITHAQVSNLFWINVLMSSSASFLLIASAPAMVWFFRETRLLELTRVLAVIFLLNGLTVQHRAILGRQMRFSATSMIDVVATAIGSAVGIAMALANFRYWSLVGQMITSEVGVVLLTWRMCQWRPGCPTLRSGTRPLVTFGARIAASTFILALARGSDVVMIGRFFGADAVGLYSRAMALLIRPLDQILPALHSVFVPALSRLQNDPARYRRAFLRTFEAIALTVFPATGLLLALAEPLTRVVFGPGWEGVTPIFASLTIAGLFLPLTNVATWIFYSAGRGTDWLKASLLLSILTVISFGVGLPFGATGVALAFSISGVLILQPVLFYLVGQRGPVSMIDLWIGVLRYLPVWGVVCGASYLARTMVAELPATSQLLICVPVAVTGGVLFGYVFAPIRHSAATVLEAIRGLRVRSDLLR